MSNSTSSPSYLSDAQEATLALVPLLPACLSILSSCTLLSLIIRSKFARPYHRILFGMSVYDIFNSIVISLQTFLVPAATSRRRWAVGSDRTCAALGFGFQFSYPSFLYFGMLSYYYILTIRFGIKEETFGRRIEPWMHVFTLGFPTCTAVIGAVKRWYGENQIGPGCWLASETDDCDQDCMERIEWIFAGFVFMFILLSVIVNNTVVWWHVRRTLRRSGRHSMRGGQDQQIQAVATQAMLFVGVFCMTYTWTVIIQLSAHSEVGASEEERLYPVLLLRAFFLPMMGVGTLLVYSRPRYLRIRQQFPERSKLWAFHCVLATSDADSSGQRRFAEQNPLDQVGFSSLFFFLNRSKRSSVTKIDVGQVDEPGVADVPSA